MYRESLEEAKAVKVDLITQGRKLHTMPELGLGLPDAGTFVRERLEEMGIPYEIKVNGSCVIGILRKGDRCFMLRSDMNGPPFQEEPGEEFASRNGRMRTCGHDLHATVLPGATRLLRQYESELKGQAKPLFQPGEEIFQGARAVIEEGILGHPEMSSAFAMHVAAQMSPEYVTCGSLPMTRVYGFRVTLIEQGGHDSRPEKCIDPISTGVHAYLALQELIIRGYPAISEAASTVGQFCVGSASNVIPETIVLQRTIGSSDEKTMSHLIAWLNEIVPPVAGTYCIRAEIEVISDALIVRCNEELNQETVERLKELEPELKAVCVYYVMGSEDFAYIPQKIPASYMCVGTGIENVSKRYAEHNPRVHFHESALVKGAAIYTRTAVR